MNGSWQYFLMLIILSLLFQGYFTMMEMAFVSFNKVRLEYYVNKKNKKALWLAKLLHNPTYLFGTTLIGANFFMQFGSECARMFYYKLGLNPSIAPATQIFLVVILAELSPMFAARLHAEQTAIFGITPIYFLSKILTPIVWVLNCICRFIDFLIGVKSTNSNYLTREELQNVIEAKDEKHHNLEEDELNTLVKNIFDIKTKSSKELMYPINTIQMVAYDTIAVEVKNLLSKKFTTFIPLFYEKKENIFGIIYSRDLLRLDDNAPVRVAARTPWFITENNLILQVIKQFRINNSQLAVVLNDDGEATGILTLEMVVDEIFNNTTHIDIEQMIKPQIIIDRSFLANKKIKEINKLFGINLPDDGEETLEGLMCKLLNRSVQKSEIVRIGRFELTLEDVPFLANRRVRIVSI